MIRKRLLALFILQVMLVLLLAGLYLQLTLANAFEKELGMKLEALAATVSSQLDASLVTLLSPGDENGRVYNSLQAKLAMMAKAGQMTRIVVFSPQGATWLDSQNRLAIAADYSRFEFDKSEIEQALQNRTSQSPLFTGLDGMDSKSGYAPLHMNGMVKGVVAVQGSAASLRIVRDMQTRLLQIGLLALAVAVLLSWFTSRRLTKPLLTLRKAAERLGKGDMEQAIPVSGRDEIAFLGSTMEEMRQAILQRDEQQKAMLAGVAHELRNPLGGIELFAGLLADDAADDSARQRAQRILNETRNLKTLVQDFLEYARPISPKPQRTLVAACWTEAVEWMKSQNRHIEFVLQGDEQVWVDPQHLKQILLNLALNAVHAVGDHGRVTCTVTRHKGRCWVDVADTGKGIAENIQPRIFEPFFSSKEKGLGLGLAMVKVLVEANKGSVQLLRSDATGTCFRLELEPAP